MEWFADGADGFFGNVSTTCGRHYLVVAWPSKSKRDAEASRCAEQLVWLYVSLIMQPLIGD